MQSHASFAQSQQFLQNEDSQFSSSQFNSESFAKMNFNEDEIISLINVLQNKIKSSRQEVNLPLQRNPTPRQNESNPNLHLNSQINVFPDYFQAKSRNNQLETFAGKRKSLEQILFGSGQENQNKHVEFSLNKEWLKNGQEEEREPEQEHSQSSDISDIVLESEQKFEITKTPKETYAQSEDTENETKRRIEQKNREKQQHQINKQPNGIILDQEKLFVLFSENLYLKDEIKEINHKLDLLISQRENDKLIIETLKDHLVSINQLLQRKDDEYNRLLTQHETLLLEKWHESQRNKQVQNSIQSTQVENLNSMIDTSESLQKYSKKLEKSERFEKNKENIQKPMNVSVSQPKQVKKSQSSQQSIQNILNEKNEDKQYLEQLSINQSCF